MIRPIVPDDIAAILALTQSTNVFQPYEIDTLEAVLDDYFRENSELDHRSVVFAERDEIIGFVYHAPEEMTIGSWTLWWIVVHPERQGQGLGRKLLAYAEADARTHGAARYFIETSSLPVYEPTRQFYLRTGYTLNATVTDYYNAGDDKLIYRKGLV
jgi:GNAT superfamily N-acetyltransferase